MKVLDRRRRRLDVAIDRVDAAAAAVLPPPSERPRPPRDNSPYRLIVYPSTITAAIMLLLGYGGAVVWAALPLGFPWWGWLAAIVAGVGSVVLIGIEIVIRHDEIIAWEEGERW